MVFGISVVTRFENETNENLVSVFCYDTIFNLSYLKSTTKFEAGCESAIIYFVGAHESCNQAWKIFIAPPTLPSWVVAIDRVEL